MPEDDMALLIASCCIIVCYMIRFLINWNWQTFRLNTWCTDI